MSSNNYHLNQYEQNRHEEISEMNMRKKVLTGMRAVLQNYISREESGTGSGMGKFDTLIHDRIIEWRTYERNRKAKKFTLYFIATFFIVPIMMIFGAFDSWLKVLSFSVGVFVVSWMLQYAKTIAIKGHAATDTYEGREGVRKAIADIWFETILSVKLSYIYALLLLTAWALLALYFGEDLGNIITSWTNFILGFFGFELTGVNPYYLILLIFIINFSSLLGDYLFWRLLYPRKVKKESDDS